MDLRMKNIDKIAFTFVISLVLVSGIAFAVGPVIFGQMFDGTTPADGSIVTVYPQSDPSDTVTDIVGPTGNFGVSSYWKVNLNNLATDVQNGDVIVVNISNGNSNTVRFYTVNMANGAVNYSMNYNLSYQDYDSDSYFASSDCNDNNAALNPGASDTCGDGIDQDCSGSDTSCPENTAPSGGSSSSGGGGGGGSSFNWQCTEWSECTPQGAQTRTCTLSPGPGFSTKPAESQPCTYTTAESAQSSGGTSPSAGSGASQTETAGEEPAAAPEPAATPTAPTGLAAITGEAVADVITSPYSISLLIVLILAGLGYYTYKKSYKSKKRYKKQ